MMTQEQFNKALDFAKRSELVTEAQIGGVSYIALTERGYQIGEMLASMALSEALGESRPYEEIIAEQSARDN